MEIANDVEPPKESPVFFEEPKKGRRKSEPKPVDQVLENLKMLGLVVKKSGTVQETHIRIQDGFAIACVGELTVGCPLAFGINAVVKHHDLLEAKKVSGTEFACTHLPGQHATVVAGDVHMVVSTDNSGAWDCPHIDTAIAPATDRLRDVIVAVAPFSGHTRPDVVGILCQANTAVATNGFAMLEAFHGVDMPPNLRLPISFAKKLEKIKRPVKEFGFSEFSFTLWFEDGSFIRTAMYPGQYWSYWEKFNYDCEFELVDLPQEFFKALKAIKPFAKDGFVYFKDGRIYTAKQAESASSFVHEAIPNGFGFAIDTLLLAAPHAQTVKFLNTCDKIVFECGNVRGVVMAIDGRPAQRIAQPVRDEQYDDNWDDDVPF